MKLSLNGYSKNEKYEINFDDLTIEEVDFILKHERWSVGILESEMLRIVLDYCSKRQNKFYTRPSQC